MVADNSSVRWSTMIVAVGNGMTVCCAPLYIIGHMPPQSWCSTGLHTNIVLRCILT